MNCIPPTEWTTVPLGEIAEINPRHPKGIADSVPVTFVPMACLNENKSEFQVTAERPLGDVRKGFTHFAEGDVLFAKITPCMENGKGGVARNLKNGLGCGTTEIHVIRPSNRILADYIYLYLAQPSIRNSAKENFTGSAGQARVPTSFINALPIPVPPLSEQRRIVAKLEKVLEKVNACQQRLEKIPTILKRLRQSILSAACSGRLTANWRNPNLESTEVPVRWKKSSVGEVIESLKYGTSQKCTPLRTGLPVLRIPNVANGSINLVDLKYAELPPKELNQLRLKEGDILLIRSNGSVSLVGKCALVGKREVGYAYAGYLIRLRPDLTVIKPEFLNWILSSYDIRLQIELEARSTSGVNNINSEELRSLRILVPPLAEQMEIVRRAEEFFALVGQIETRYKKAKAHIEKLTQSILAKAFRGEIVPYEPAEEPSSICDYSKAKKLRQATHSAHE